MSTRCQIVHVSRNGSLYPCKIYKHSDGYPDGVLPTLAPFALEFDRERGDDAEYFIAQAIRRFAIEDAHDAAADPEAARFYDPTKSLLGWGVSTYWHGDIQYLYVVRAGGVQAYEVTIPNNQPEDAIPAGTLVEWEPAQ